MNAKDIKHRLGALREKINTALRAADTSLLHSVPDDIEAIINLVDGKPAPTHQDGSPWTPESQPGSHPAKAGGDPAIDTDVPPTANTPAAETTPAPTTTEAPGKHLSGADPKAKVDDKKAKR